MLLLWNNAFSSYYVSLTYTWRFVLWYNYCSFSKQQIRFFFHSFFNTKAYFPDCHLMETSTPLGCYTCYQFVLFKALICIYCLILWLIIVHVLFLPHAVLTSPLVPWGTCNHVPHSLMVSVIVCHQSNNVVDCCEQSLLIPLKLMLQKFFIIRSTRILKTVYGETVH